MPKANKEKPPPGPDDLVRAAAGEYQSGDGRFTVRSSDTNWYVVDNELSNEFGQDLIHGPFGTLAKARDGISGARAVKPLLRSVARPKKQAKAGAAEKPKPAAPPVSWIDKLPANEASAARQLVRALEKEGLPDADDLVRLHSHDRAATIAKTVVERRLNTIVDDAPASQQEELRQLVRRVLAVLTSDGTTTPGGMPRWALVELNDDPAQPARKIVPRI